MKVLTTKFFVIEIFFSEIRNAPLFQERAIKGFQPELNRMTTAHEEELAEVHKCYKKQLEESEETCNRRMAVQKEKFEAEREKALAIEREIWRQKYVPTSIPYSQKGGMSILKNF